MELDILDCGSRKSIYSTIASNPGLHYRELQRRIGMANGSLQYHLGRLEKGSLVKSEKSKNTVRYFALNSRRIEGEEKILPVLREARPRRILLAMLSGRNYTISRLMRKIKLPYSSTSRLLARLSQAGIVEKSIKGNTIHYLVERPAEIMKMLSSYRQSFLDSQVDCFVDSWNEGGTGKGCPA